jgi:hypothetical protein
VHVAYDPGGGLPTPGIAAHYVGPRPLDRYYESPRYQLMPSASGFVELRFTLSGPIPGVSGLGYRASAAYNTASHGAYFAGPGAQFSPPALNTFPLAPVDQFRVFVGLRYDFGASSSSDSGEGT